MAMVANTETTFTTVGIRESLSNVISNISPTETPILSGAKKGTAQQTFNEHQLDALQAAVTTNAQLEGNQITAYDAAVQPVRVGNYQQISTKTLLTSGTTDAVVTAGRAKESAYQIAKKGLEMKRDMEATICANQAAAAGSTTVARQTAGLLAWIKSNTDKGATGVDPVYTSVPNNARTDGTARTFSEAILKNAITLQYKAGGHCDTVLMSPKNKLVFSSFVGVATKYAQTQGQKQAVTIGAADIYVSDFGVFSVQVDLFQRDKDAFVVDFSLVGIDYLRNYRVIELPFSGDAKAQMMLAEWGTNIKNEAGLALCADLGL